MGPILPQLSVYGKQLGVSSEIMGYITSFLPILYVLAKPVAGFLADYFSNCRKFIFVCIILIMSLSYSGFYFIPPAPPHKIDIKSNFSFSVLSGDLNICDDQINISHEAQCSITRHLNCTILSSDIETPIKNFKAYISSLKENESSTFIKDLNSNETFKFCVPNITIDYNLNFICNIDDIPECLYNTATFWIYLILLCLGTIGYNVTNSISDAVCFDFLGDENEMKYGAQRVWGTIGFGISALIAGIAVDLASDDIIKSIRPALIIMLIFTGFDLMSVSKLKLPKFLTSESIVRDVYKLLLQPSISIFLVFATLAGIMDAFIIYFMFWHLEEVAEATGYMAQVKLIEGFVIAAECLCGEIPFFLYSGKILKKLGYVHCLTLCFFTYSIRLFLISWIPNPWYLIPVEMIMQGCTYALCYTCIVAYASAIAPPGTSATVQGLVAGMDDGLGFSIGSFIGGLSMKYWGGRKSFRIFSIGAIITCIAHFILRPASKHETHRAKQKTNVVYEIPSEQVKINENS
ncbi:major facilitator superfamily domain-containing protein 6 isoform X2 [Condylostylus longicornis]|nr:major facilitator superfamily domain-containing protein 6 isoform X2 [Condylostylus longicornis]